MVTLGRQIGGRNEGVKNVQKEAAVLELVPLEIMSYYNLTGLVRPSVSDMNYTMSDDATHLLAN